MPKLGTTNIENVPDILGVLNLKFTSVCLTKHPGSPSEYFALKADGKRCDGSVVKVSYTLTIYDFASFHASSNVAIS